MKSCYCYETNENYKSISACLEALGIPKSKYGNAAYALKNSSMIEIDNYHIGYSKEEVEAQLEEWVQPIPDLDIEVNRKGEVRKKSTKALRKPTYDGLGYLYVSLNYQGKNKFFKVHRLVAQAFLPEFEDHKYIDHRNGIRDDNRLENLRVVTQGENMALRDKNNKPLYNELRRLVLTYGYDGTLEKLKAL